MWLGFASPLLAGLFLCYPLPFALVLMFFWRKPQVSAWLRPAA